MKKIIFLCVLVVFFASSVMAQEVETKTLTGTSDDGLLILKSDDGKFSLMLDGRINLGAALYMGNENPLGSGLEVRRARLGLKPTWGDWSAQFDIDFSGNEVDVKDMWIGYGGFKNMMITLGNHKGQWSVEEVTSSRFITFMERGLPNAFAPDRRLGLSIAKWGKNWRAFAGLFGEEAGNVDETGTNEALNYNLRLNVLPLFKDNMFIHVGGAFGHSVPFANDEGSVKFSSRPESHVTDTKFLNTGKIKKVDSWDQYGLEFAAAAGPFLFQAEYASVKVKRVDGEPNAKFSGYYAFASWMITGEKRPYSIEEGEPAGRIYPKNKKLGAFELAARISSLDLTDEEAEIMGGKGQNITLAANWYPYPNLKFTVNYILVNNDENATADGDFAGNDDFNVLQFGFYYSF
jgi:phosphate-selective porin OprO/OprP